MTKHPEFMMKDTPLAKRRTLLQDFVDGSYEGTQPKMQVRLTLRLV